LVEECKERENEEYVDLRNDDILHDMVQFPMTQLMTQNSLNFLIIAALLGLFLLLSFCLRSVLVFLISVFL